ncbi:nuclear pore complex protein NUP133 isoform X1 [Tripterygium wilfordii]|uniref:nuclear pore complex protein NUP133 isoform X1 n=1 Tax=Tripterygium wilfordii TaxID=458696 RepID=UPI0018F7EC35|nr:nuclear pore complex protein NUP133 isoform X1 [Tripterygium wilfordii]
MFSPGTKRSKWSSHKQRNVEQTLADSPITPLADHRKSVADNSIPNRPTTGTPAPWTPARSSVLARFSGVNNSEKGNEADSIRPVFVAEFPQVVRDEQTSFLRKHVRGDACISGGMDKETCFSWIVCGNRLFIWSYLTYPASKKCIVLELPSVVSEDGDLSRTSYDNNSWILCVVDWDRIYRGGNKVLQPCNSAGIVLCNRKTRAVVYWPDIYGEGGSNPVVSLASSDESEVNSPSVDGKSLYTRQQQRSKRDKSPSSFNSFIASAVPATQHAVVALACSSSGELWKFCCRPTGIQRNLDLSLCPEGSDGCHHVGGEGYPRSLIWRFSPYFLEDTKQFFLLTDHEILCLNITLNTDLNVSKLWSHEIVGSDGDLGIKKDLAGQKRVWPLDAQVDDNGKVITVLVATFCKDRISSSTYTQYSLLTMQYKSGVNTSSGANDRFLEKRAPIQVIIPKARVEDEDFLFSMRLRIGGKPPGSVTILSGDGTATVSHYYRNSTRLYQFDLPYDAWKVLDASILPSSDDGEDGAWVVLTEKAGIWAIPDKAVILGGVEPPERSLSRKGSSNEESPQEEKRIPSFSGNIGPKRATSEGWATRDRQKAVTTGIARRTVQDEESETLLGQLFNDFLQSGQVDASLEKLKNSGAFDRDGEANVFTRASKSIVDTLAKHWTTTRGAEIVSLTVISRQLVEKKRKHQKYLQFLALSKCHEELCSSQRHALQIVLEHGEKLAGVIQMRELQNLIRQDRTNGDGLYSGSEGQNSGALWDLIQLVGEKARQNTVLLMDRDNAEVFYSKIADLEEVFSCLDRHLEYAVGLRHPLGVQIHRACELSNACVALIRTAMQYRNEHQMWYPPPEGLTPWYCQHVVRNGLWSIASFMLKLLNDTSELDVSAKSDLCTHLELLSEVLLEAYSGAITAKFERGEECKGLLDEYWNRRDIILDSLYQQAKNSSEVAFQDLNVGTEEQRQEIFRKLSSSLLAIAKRHEGYKTMWKICCDLNDSELLRNLMHESVGPRGGFSNFVFKQLYEKKQFSKLLRLGEEFQEELSIFLRHHRDLRWLHELFLHQFSIASETLHVLGLSQDDHSFSEAGERADPDLAYATPTLADRRRFLNLSKIAAVAAGKNADWEAKVKRIEADLKILKLQEEIIKLLAADDVEQYDGRRLLHPEEVIELCLKSEEPELALRAFDVFAWTSSSFRKSHKSLLEECWKIAADLDDWGKLHQACIDEGWSDDEMLKHLRDTLLFQASSRCYGPLAEAIEGGFDEVFPLSQANLDQDPRDSDLSVEAILMQHKDFPDAGKLMLDAIMLGLEHDAVADDGIAPME